MHDLWGALMNANATLKWRELRDLEDSSIFFSPALPCVYGLLVTSLPTAPRSRSSLLASCYILCHRIELFTTKHNGLLIGKPTFTAADDGVVFARWISTRFQICKIVFVDASGDLTLLSMICLLVIFFAVICVQRAECYFLNPSLQTGC